ncbi:MAG: hypothetical protein ISQ06_12970 [Planctomycetaceae bacterium]|nr:hypothetical protein [Planctomycetaceae bacterium]
MLISWLKNTMRRRPVRSQRRRVGRAVGYGQLESLEPRQLLTASVVNFDPNLTLTGWGIQDDGDIVVGGYGYIENEAFVGVLITLEPDGESSEARTVTTPGGETAVLGISPNGKYFTGNVLDRTAIVLGGYYSRAQESAFLAEVDNPEILTRIPYHESDIAPSSFGNDVSDSGVVVGSKDGLAEAFEWSHSSGLVTLSEPDHGANAFSISSSGASVGHQTTLASDNYHTRANATKWDNGDPVFLPTPDDRDSLAIEISTNGEYIGGLFFYDDLTYFESIQEAVVWQNGELTRLTHADGEFFNGRVTSIADNGFAVGDGADGTFIWHESFAGVRQLDEFLSTEHDLHFDTQLYSADDVQFDAATGNLRFLVASASETDCIYNPDIPSMPICTTIYGHQSLVTVQMPTTPEFTIDPDAAPDEPALRWQSPLTAEVFELEFRDAAGLIYRVGSITDTTFIPEDLLIPGDYRARVRAIDADGGVSSWSQPAEFTVTSDVSPSVNATHRGTDESDDLIVDITGLTRVLIETGAGNDRVVVHGTLAEDAVITINTGDGNDTVILETTAAVTVNLGAGNDRFFGNPDSTSPVTVFGGSGIDRIHGGGGHDLLLGEDGNDWLYGWDGDDTLDGGNGRNRLFGHQGNDYLIGGNQRDIAKGGSGDDVIDLGSGNDVANGGSGNDILLGGDGNDRLRAGGGNDSLFGGSGSDRLFSFQGNNYLSGGNDNDLICSLGTDRIDGGAGADLIRIGQPSTQVVADDNDTLRGSFGVSATRINRDENNALVDAAFARLLDLDSEYGLPLL